MIALVDEYEKAKVKISLKVAELRDLSTQLLVKAQKYEDYARGFEEKIQFYQHQIEMLMEDSNNSRKIAEILRRESKRIKEEADHSFDIEIGDLNEKLRDFIQ